LFSIVDELGQYVGAKPDSKSTNPTNPTSSKDPVAPSTAAAETIAGKQAATSKGNGVQHTKKVNSTQKI